MDKSEHLADISFGSLRELLAYPDAESEAAWDAESPDSPENSMLYLIGRPEDITVVVDNPDSSEMQSILGAIRDTLSQRFRHDEPLVARSTFRPVFH